MIRPGPSSIRRDACPGGLVLQIYAVPSERLLLERYLTDPGMAVLTAPMDAEMVDQLAPNDDVCLVVFDGDTGRRWSADDIRRAAGPHRPMVFP